MGAKRINPFEQHVEKIVVGAVTVVFLGAIASQFLTSPNEIDVGGGRKVPPGRAFDPLEQEARQLLGQINAVNVQPPELPPVTLLEDFQRRQTGSAVPRPRFAYTGKPLRLNIEAVDTGVGGDRIAWPDLPAPASVLAAQHSCTLDPFYVASHPELAAALPSVEQPIDVTIVTVEGRLDVRAIEAALQSDPDGPGGELKPMPAGWWRDGLEIIAVRAERQELISADVWGEPQPVPPLPGSVDLLAPDESGLRPLMSDVILAARDYADDIRHPPFFPIIAGPDWLPPRELRAQQGEGDVQGQLEAKKRLLRSIDRDIALKERALEELGAAPARTEPATRPGGVQPGGRGRPGAPQPPQTNPSTPTREERAAEARRNLIQRQLDALKARRDTVVAELRNLGYNPEPSAPGIEEEEPPYVLTDADRLLANTEPVRLWVHDLAASPGRTYRYRMVVELNNPLFGRSAVLPEDQREYAERLTITTAASDWTDPIEVDRKRYYFVASAKPESEGALGSRKATVDAYEFYYGFWRKGTVTLDPGDFVRASVDLPELFVYEVSGAGTSPAQPAEPAAQPPGRPGLPAPGPGEILAPPPTGPGVLTPPVPGAPAAGPPPGGIPLPTEREIVLQAQLIDVAPPVRSGEPVRVIFLDPLRGLTLRTPDEDRASPIRARLEDSARAGVTQGLREPEPEEPLLPLPQRRERRPEPTPPPAPVGPGGGGGGGG